MLFLQFQLNDDRYAIDCAQILEVLPLLELKQLPQAPAGVAGAFNYRGTPVPVLDLSALAVGRPARALMSTRTLIVNYPDAQGHPHPLGLIVERATQTLRLQPGDFRDAGVDCANAPYLGPVHADDQGLVQWVDVQRLLPPAIGALLFTQTREALQ